VAGSIAGVTEHSFMFPFDTMKTIMQVRNAPAGAGGSAPAMAASEWGVIPAFAQMAEQQGMRRLWRGVQTMFTGCIPAHSAYFTIYESCKPVFGRWLAGAPHEPAAAEAGDEAVAAVAAATAAVPVPPREAALAAGAAVALGTMVHDLVMTPMDVCKQRLQLGYHKNSVYDCACAIMRQEGARAFVISYPTTVVMNIPYALVMGTTNEAIRNTIDPSGHLSVGGYFAAGATAGIVAAAATNPLDVVKTRLQTQHLALQQLGAVQPTGAAAGSALSSAAIDRGSERTSTDAAQATARLSSWFIITPADESGRSLSSKDLPVIVPCMYERHSSLWRSLLKRGAYLAEKVTSQTRPKRNLVRCAAPPPSSCLPPTRRVFSCRRRGLSGPLGHRAWVCCRRARSVARC